VTTKGLTDKGLEEFVGGGIGSCLFESWGQYRVQGPDKEEFYPEPSYGVIVACLKATKLMADKLDWADPRLVHVDSALMGDPMASGRFYSGASPQIEGFQGDSPYSEII